MGAREFNSLSQTLSIILKILIPFTIIFFGFLFYISEQFKSAPETIFIDDQGRVIAEHYNLNNSNPLTRIVKICD